MAYVILQSCKLPKHDLQRFAKGSLNKLVVMKNPPAAPTRHFNNLGGEAMSLTGFRGKVVLLNIWATWCVPCVAEIPSLDTLESEWGGANFEVVAVSMDRHQVDAESFFNTKKIKHLKIYHDPSLSLSNDVGESALPISIFYNAYGQEIARISGEVDWQSAEAKAFLSSILN